MASMKKIDYPSANTYIVQFTWKKEASFLILGYNIDNKFQFIDLETGRIMNLSFDTVEDAEKWLRNVANIVGRNIICQTYVP